MSSNHRIEVPLRSGGGKKMKKRRELDALLVNSLTTRKVRRALPGSTHSQDKLLSISTDDADDYSTTNGSIRLSHKKNVYCRMCGLLLVGLTVALFITTFYWLYFDLRQQILDYRQKFDEVSAISKSFPDTMQKWHETSSFLMKNQSLVIYQINELQRSLESLRSSKASLNLQQNYDNEEKLVAGFGAKLEAMATDIDEMKEHCINYKDIKKEEVHTEELKPH